MWLGAAAYRLNIDAARVTRTNLATCLPHMSHDERETLCRNRLTHMMLLFFEFAQLAHWPQDKLLAQIREVQGKDLLDQAYDSGRGVLLLVPHFGNWEVFCAFLGVNYRFAALYDPPKIQSLETVILQARQRFRATLYAIDTGGMRGLLRALHQGELVGILPDQVPERSAGVYADFFGRPALTMTLIPRLIAKHRPEVLIGSVERVPDANGFSYRVRVERPLAEVDGVDRAACNAVVNRCIERIVERAPEQYQWEYKRFKRPPNEGLGNIYRRQ